MIDKVRDCIHRVSILEIKKLIWGSTGLLFLLCYVVHTPSLMGNRVKILYGYYEYYYEY